MLPEDLDGLLVILFKPPAHALKKPIKLMRVALPCVFPSFSEAKAPSFFKTPLKGQLIVYRLPSYSPDFNLIEKLWKNTKKDATHCKFFATFEELRVSVVKAFEKYMQDATKVICVMKKLRRNAGLA